MDIFRVHQELIDEYKSFTTSALVPRDPRIAGRVWAFSGRGTDRRCSDPGVVPATAYWTRAPQPIVESVDMSVVCATLCGSANESKNV
jgi:hypothetical protein